MIIENIYELKALFIYSYIHAASVWSGSLTFGVTRASSRVSQAVYDHNVGPAPGLGLQLCRHFLLM